MNNANSSNLNKLFLILSLITVFSCSEKIDIQIEGPENLVLECYLRPAEEITATLQTVANFTDIHAVYRPENARVYLLTDIDTPFEFEYDAQRQLYYIPKKFHTPNPSFKYEIRASIPAQEETELSAKTTFSPPMRFKIEEVKGAKMKQIGNKLDVNGFFASATPRKNNNFYRIKAYYKTRDKQDRLSELKKLNFKGNMEDPLAFYHADHADGILVDLNRVDASSFTMRFESPEEYGPGQEFSDYLYLSVESVSEDVYRYEVSIAKQISAIQNGTSDPVITYTNVTNGYGLLGSGVVTFDSLRIN